MNTNRETAPFTRLLVLIRRIPGGRLSFCLWFFTQTTQTSIHLHPHPWHHNHHHHHHPAPARHHSQNEVHSRGDPREHLPGKQEPHVAGGWEKPALHKAQLDEVRHEQLNPCLIPAGCSASLKRKPWRGEQAEGRGPGPVQEHSNTHHAVGIMNSRRGSRGGGDKVRNPGPQPRPHHGHITPSMVFRYSKCHG